MKRVMFILGVFLISILLIQDNIVKLYAACTTSNYFGPECGPKPNNTCSSWSGGSSGTVYYSEDNYVACGGDKGYYGHVFVCDTPCGGGGTGGTQPPPEREYIYGPNCPSGTKIDLNQLERSWCTRSGAPPEYSTWWTPRIHRYVLGNSERSGSCCETAVIEPRVCGDWYSCPTPNNPNKVCRDCTEEEIGCVAYTVSRYACVPDVPPITITNTVQSSGETMGCTIAPGYVGRNANNSVRINVTTPTSFGGGTVSDMRLWIGATPLASESLSAVLPQALGGNGNYGLMVKKVGSTWTDVYAPTKHTSAGVQATLQGWTRIGSLTTPLPGGGVRTFTINGSNGKPMVRITNLSVTTSGTNTIMTGDLNFLHSDSGLPDFESSLNRLYNLRGAARYSNGTGNTPWVTSPSNFTLDLINPTNETFSLAITGDTTVNLSWAFSDVDPNGGGNGFVRSVGNARRLNPGRIEDTIDRLTPPPNPVSNYVLGSVPEDSNLFNSTNSLWRRVVTSMTENINLKNNEGGSIEFYAHGFDKACNYTRSATTLPLGDPWITTKGGVLYSSGGTAFEMPELTGPGFLSGGLTGDTYWRPPYGFPKSDTDLTTEVLSSSSTMLNTLLKQSTLNSTRLMNRSDSNGRANYWFDRLSERADSQVRRYPDDFNVVNFPAAFSLNQNSSSTTVFNLTGGTACTAGKACVVKVGGNLTVGQNFTCNLPTLFLVNGTTSIAPNVSAPIVSNGCIFVSRGDTTIGAGSYKSSGSTYALFDVVEAYVITDGLLNIASGDVGVSPRDGLKVNGGVMAFGQSGSRSVVLSRRLTLGDASTLPAFAVHYDYRYLNLATKFFGGDFEGFKSEVGFKPF